MLQPKYVKYNIEAEHKVVLSWDLDMFLKENILILGQITCGCVLYGFLCVYSHTKIYNAMAMPYNMLYNVRMEQLNVNRDMNSSFFLYLQFTYRYKLALYILWRDMVLLLLREFDCNKL